MSFISQTFVQFKQKSFTAERSSDSRIATPVLETRSFHRPTRVTAPTAGLYNTVLRVRCGASVYVAVLRGEEAELGHEENPVIHSRSDSSRVCRER